MSSPIRDAYAAAVDRRREAGHTARDESLADRPHDQQVWSYVERLGTRGISNARRQISQLIRDEGMTTPGTDASTSWDVDPLPVVLGADDWSVLKSGLRQRARLLDAILADLHGTRRLIRERILPGDLFLGHDGYLLPAAGIQLPGPRQLPVAAVDLAHTPDGWTVITDRTQAPAGFGYAMAHRRLVTRVMEPLFRTMRSHRLRGFFDVLQHTLVAAAPPGITSPRIALYSPGPASETAYDQALVATLLGHPVVESDDLEVRDGMLWMRSAGEPQRVHVLQRRVDGDWADPLDLRPDSRLGVTGLLAAARRGAVSIVNPIGAGVLENVGMTPFLGAAARALLDEDLALPSPETWWCGDDASRSHVLAHLDELVIRPNSRSVTPTVVLGSQLSAAERDELAARIEAEPWAWSAQTPVEASTAPVVTGDGLEPRAMSLRTFRVAFEDDYVMMPGGVAKVSRDPDAPLALNRFGTIAKDVWVLEGAAAPLWTASTLYTAPDGGAARLPALTPRAAGDLFWFGRYCERIEATARLVAITDNLAADHLPSPGSSGFTALTQMLDALGQITGCFTAPGDDEDRTDRVAAQLRRALLDAGHAGTVGFAVEHAAENAVAVRDLLPATTVGLLGEMREALAEARDDEDANPQDLVTEIIKSSLALSGVAGDSLVRDELWAYVDAGRKLERAQSTVALLQHTICHPHSPVTDAVVSEVVLRTCDTIITYRRRMAAGVGAALPAVAVVELLVMDQRNPRSVHFQLDRLATHYPAETHPRIHEKITAIHSTMHSIDLDSLRVADRAGFDDLLHTLGDGLRELSREIERTQFAAQATPRAFAVQEGEA